MVRQLAILTGLALALVACGGSDDDAADTVAGTAAALTGTEAETETATETTPATDAPATSTTEAPDTTAPEESTTTSTDAPAATEPPPTEPADTEPPPAPAAGNCLVGEWVVSQEEMNAFYDVVETSTDGLSMEIVGEAALHFTETEYVWLPNYELRLVVAGMEGTGVAGGSIAGTYTTDGEIVTTTVTASEMTMRLEIGGTVMDSSAIGNDFITSAPISDAPYSCDTGVPVIGFETGDGTPRHPVTLTPA